MDPASTESAERDCDLGGFDSKLSLTNSLNGARHLQTNSRPNKRLTHQPLRHSGRHPSGLSAADSWPPIAFDPRRACNGPWILPAKGSACEKVVTGRNNPGVLWTGDILGPRGVSKRKGALDWPREGETDGTYLKGDAHLLDLSHFGLKLF